MITPSPVVTDAELAFNPVHFLTYFHSTKHLVDLREVQTVGGRIDTSAELCQILDLQLRLEIGVPTASRIGNNEANNLVTFDRLYHFIAKCLALWGYRNKTVRRPVTCGDIHRHWLYKSERFVVRNNAAFDEGVKLLRAD